MGVCGCTIDKKRTKNSLEPKEIRDKYEYICMIHYLNFGSPKGYEKKEGGWLTEDGFGIQCEKCQEDKSIEGGIKGLASYKRINNFNEDK